MRYCTLTKAVGGEFIGCDAVDDAHPYGLTPDGNLLHTEGVYLPEDRWVAFGAARGNMADLYSDPHASLTPCGHPEGTPDAA
jgi:hypothetical protein